VGVVGREACGFLLDPRLDGRCTELSIMGAGEVVPPIGLLDAITGTVPVVGAPPLNLAVLVLVNGGVSIGSNG